MSFTLFSISLIQLLWRHILTHRFMKTINFETGFLRDVKNSKYVSIYCRIVDQLQQADFKHKHLLDTIELLTLYDITLKDHWGNIKYKNTPEIQELHKERRKRLASFRDLVDKLTNLKGFISESNAVLLQKWLKPLRPKIGSRNTLEEMRIVYEIVSSVDFYNDLNAAIKEANLLNFVDDLAELNNKIIDLETERQEHVSTRALGQERKLNSYEDLKMVLWVLNSVIKVGTTDAELAQRVGMSIDAMLRRERGYVRMVGTKKEIREERESENENKTD